MHSASHEVTVVAYMYIHVYTWSKVVMYTAFAKKNEVKHRLRLRVGAVYDEVSETRALLVWRRFVRKWQGQNSKHVHEIMLNIPEHNQHEQNYYFLINFSCKIVWFEMLAKFFIMERAPKLITFICCPLLRFYAYVNKLLALRNDC